MYSTSTSFKSALFWLCFIYSVHSSCLATCVAWASNFRRGDVGGSESDTGSEAASVQRRANLQLVEEKAVAV